MRTPSTRRGWKYAVLVAGSLALAFHLPGCTIIGLESGAAFDRRSSRGGPERLIGVEPGRRITLLLVDGRSIQGRFQRWSYDSSAVPADSLAWERDVAQAKDAWRDEHYRPLLTQGDEPETWLAQRRILSLPSLTLHVDSDSGEVAVPVAMIGKVAVPTTGGMVAGLIAGATVDILLITVVVRGMHDGVECGATGGTPLTFWARPGPAPGAIPPPAPPARR